MNLENKTYVRARIDIETKLRATDALEAMGLSVSDAIRLLMVRVAEEKRMPFEIRVPNRETLEAMEELESGKGKSFQTISGLMDELHADD